MAQPKETTGPAPRHCILKYSQPRLVTTQKDDRVSAPPQQPAAPPQTTAKQRPTVPGRPASAFKAARPFSRTAPSRPVQRPITPGDFRKTAPSPVIFTEDKTSLQGFSAGEIQALLDELLPPREWCNDATNEKWVQSVSSEPATPMHVSQFIEKVKERLTAIRSRFAETLPTPNATSLSICCGATSTETENVFSESLDEIIRETVIACADRGKLLARMRDETDRLTNAWSCAAESSVAFAIRKRQQRAARAQELLADATKARSDLKTAHAQRDELVSQMKGMEETYSNETELMQQEHAAAMTALEAQVVEAADALRAVA
eukprot:Polyplicarium_translucidae@DN2002_c0_g1_i1.p1